MANEQRTAERVRRLLSARSDVVEKRMVGGLSFMVGGKMCCGVTADGLMVRVGPEALGATLTEPHVKPMWLGERALKGFVVVDPTGYRTDRALANWVQRGIDFVTQAD